MAGTAARHARRWRRWRRAIVATAVAAAVLGVGGPGDTRAADTGLSSQTPIFFGSGWFKLLGIHKVRLAVPWNAGLRDGPWDAWLRQAQIDGLDVLVAFGRDPSMRCPEAPCTLPKDAAYRAAVRAFAARYPWVREITAWNEPNHRNEPTFHYPLTAAGYYEAAREACPDCTVVAGDFLDDVNLADYFAAYRGALTSRPSVWGLHNYYDATYFESGGVERVLAGTTGELWLTETGGIVRFGGVSYDEQRAADSVRWVYRLADRHPRIRRLYLYGWEAASSEGFDSGLVGPDGRPRPAYTVVAEHAGAPLAAAIGERRPAGRRRVRGWRARPAGKLFRLLPASRLRVGAACVEARRPPHRCTGILRIRVGPSTVDARFDLRRGQRATTRVRVPVSAWTMWRRARRPKVRVAICDRDGRCGRWTRMPLRARNVRGRQGAS